MDQHTYTEHKKKNQDALLKQAEQHDKAILALSSGALALSLTFLRTIAPSPSSGSLWLLGFSWGAFLVSVLSTLLSFHTSVRAFLRADEILDEMAQNPGIDAHELPNRWRSHTLLLNYTAVACFAVGTVLLTAFAIVNLDTLEKPISQKGSEMKRAKITPKDVSTELGAVPTGTPIQAGGGRGAVPTPPPREGGAVPTPPPRQPPPSPPPKSK